MTNISKLFLAFVLISGFGFNAHTASAKLIDHDFKEIPKEKPEKDKTWHDKVSKELDKAYGKARQWIKKEKPTLRDLQREKKPVPGGRKAQNKREAEDRASLRF